jgi:fructuronate reductase
VDNKAKATYNKLNMKLNNQSLKDLSFWENADIALPRFNREKMIAATMAAPKWVHFGAGNIFRALPAAMAQRLLDDGNETTGIIVIKNKSSEIIEKHFNAFDDLSILVTLKSDGTAKKQVIASVAASFIIDRDFNAIKDIFISASLQMASFTITEKGYSLNDSAYVHDIKTGTTSCKSYMGRITSLLYQRYTHSMNTGSVLPLAMVSMDNCSHNGDILFAAVETIADGWVKSGAAETGFLDYIRDKNRVSFPWTMIDKITPGPDDNVRAMLTSCGLEDMQGFITERGTCIAPFVNAEETQYLVIEDNFPNGRPPLEKAGVLFTDRQTVDKTEKMKVCACLNPLHTSLAIFGCLLGYTRINEEMKDKDLVNLIKGVGYNEGLLTAADPVIINPKEFIDQVIKTRFPNPFLPDTPQRIATDSSYKIPIRFGETLKAYKNLNADIKFIPLVLAGWLRYLLGIDDEGKQFDVSPDPQYETLKNSLSGIILGQEGPFKEKLAPILSNTVYFGVNLYEINCLNGNIGEKVEAFFAQMTAGRGAVRKTLSVTCS